MKSFECESSSEGDEPTMHAISRGIMEPSQWLRGNPAGGWGWQAAGSSGGTGPSSSAAPLEQPGGFSQFQSGGSEEGQIPGRRTPLGTVGLGGFYFQGQPNVANHPPASDENNPGCSSQASRSQDSRMQPNSQNTVPGKGKNRQGKSVRLNINARERRRMHDLNDALDELRGVIPYAHSPSVRKLQGTAGSAAIVAPPGFDLQGFPAAAKFLQQQQALQENARRSDGNAGSSSTPGGGGGDNQIL